ncbi:MAG: EamA family transporter RarD [Gammaproteobacteria bacterium]
MAATAAAFLIWGLFPLYIAGISSVSALQITAHRVAWSCVFVLALLAFRRELGSIGEAAKRPGVLPRLAGSAILVSVNWLAFVWAVNHNQTVEVSLGYYINPLLNVLLGILVLKERLNRVQWISVAVATAGVAYLTFETGRVPWVALTVATSFGVYGLIRKVAKVEALPGLAIEMILLTPFAVGYLIWCEVNGIGSFGHAKPLVETLLVLSCVVTATPLALFSYGARLLPYSTVGILQYIAPSLQLMCAVFILGEPFQHARAVGFALIWVALVIYAIDGIARQPSIAGRIGARRSEPPGD